VGIFKMTWYVALLFAVFSSPCTGFTTIFTDCLVLLNSGSNLNVTVDVVPASNTGMIALSPTWSESMKACASTCVSWESPPFLTVTTIWFWLFGSVGTSVTVSRFSVVPLITVDSIDVPWMQLDPLAHFGGFSAAAACASLQAWEFGSATQACGVVLPDVPRMLL